MLEIKTIFKKGALIISLGGELVEGKIKEYDHGIIIEILGFEIYNNVK